jgi:excisionase family DNA binding protein
MIASTDNANNSLWDVRDVAAYLKVSRSWVYHRAEAGTLPCLRIGALVRFEPDEIRAFAQRSRAVPARLVRTG